MQIIVRENCAEMVYTTRRECKTMMISNGKSREFQRKS